MGRMSRRKASKANKLKIHVRDDRSMADAFRWLRDRASSGLVVVIDEIVTHPGSSAERNGKKAAARTRRAAAEVSV